MDENTFGVVPCNAPVDVSEANGFRKLELAPDQQMQVGALLQHLPSVAAADVMTQFYTISFPKGISGKLMELKRGGFTTTIIGENSQIAGTASLQSLAPQAMVLGCFTAMSIASSQYFLKQLHDEMKMMRMGIDKILEFLYGDKKAELMAEANFVKYAYRNFSSIMTHEHQRAAMIGSLHNSKKIAMKDIEFYMRDLDSTIGIKDGKDISGLVEKAFQIRESLEFSIQLYGMSSLLEVYYAQNHDDEYLKYVENDISIYIDKCEKRMLSSFSALKVLVDSAKGPLFKKLDKTVIEKQINDLMELLNRGEESELRRSLRTALNASIQKAEYYMTADGAIYLKIA
ncbi:hypothetical protein D1159_05790 [Pseudoflavonifractor sp. 524-17]|uniref:hypothetical protein n=1 Tax=Pseudoflavonifractor sp. 524-17 TaxID=2304577 RepID=UPI00137A1B5D|nr:hypothetical protein [Pseudoflavonifractor sp. 524-17]NCE64110.1 hypothetical protein [Pseudoflavonifractor sp. 524-17]